MENGQMALQRSGTLNLETTEAAAAWTNAALIQSKTLRSWFVSFILSLDCRRRVSRAPREGRAVEGHHHSGGARNTLRISEKQKSQRKKPLILNMYFLNLGSVLIFRKMQIHEWQANCIELSYFPSIKKRDKLKIFHKLSQKAKFSTCHTSYSPWQVLLKPFMTSEDNNNLFHIQNTPVHISTTAFPLTPPAAFPKTCICPPLHTWIMKSFSSFTSQIHRTISKSLSSASSSGLVVTSTSWLASSSLQSKLSRDDSLRVSSSAQRAGRQNPEWLQRGQITLKTSSQARRHTFLKASLHCVI